MITDCTEIFLNAVKFRPPRYRFSKRYSRSKRKKLRMVAIINYVNEYAAYHISKEIIDLTIKHPTFLRDIFDDNTTNTDRL